MKKQLIIIGIIIILLTVGLSGCNNPLDIESNKFGGTWKDPRFSNVSFIFLSDGTGSWSGDSMLWEIKDGKLVITIPSSGSEIENIYDYTFSDNDQTLTLTYVINPQINLTLIKQ